MVIIGEREKKLPVWARDLIADLRRRIEVGREPLINELAKLRPCVELLERRLGGTKELLECAAKGGHMTAQEIIEVLESYSLTLTEDKK